MAARDQASRALQQQDPRGVIQGLHHKSPSSNRMLGFVTLITGAIVTLVLGGVTIGGVGITLLLATPVFLLLSPVLVPLGIMVALGIGGFLLASTVFVGFCSFVSWIYNYVRGQKPVGADKIDAAKHRIADTASHVTEKAREVTGYLQSRTQEVAPGA
ncbi:hypothetical protein SELMODRAFT_95560 [Selaginella moellendorffii]|uniref:Oleosin n=1 Tax=Selaginella moellendorffii TaxID=88036 RepID=D8RJZ1_SELML|nr:oleosin 1 [Selaginella moellendorffii]XP_024526241.1 oleosin 1-like [Selaginella moellendorffii]EFJ27358.1 hypothetical protein SELMODRAFT_95560 [Selaginella moellendorffii]|eukprot:XP_002971609.1 oleosin 1 [Selaginella moellendorffii]